MNKLQHTLFIPSLGLDTNYTSDKNTIFAFYSNKTQGVKLGNTCQSSSSLQVDPIRQRTGD